MNHQHILFVCTSCGGTAQTRTDGIASEGEKLLHQLQHLHQDWDLREDFTIQSVTCMGVCDRSCAIAFVSPGKHTYLFSNLPVAKEYLDSTAIAVLDCAVLYHSKSDGMMAYRDRPELLRSRVLARIPSMPKLD
jgi:predicted metal-binding protein